MSYVTARRRDTNGEINRLFPEDQTVHGWYRFVLSFPPHLVRDYLERFGLNPGHRVLDPFCGTGTTLVECKKQGIPSVGIEATPMAHFASQVKVDWSPNPDGLRQHAHEVANIASAELTAQGLDGILSGAQIDDGRTDLFTLAHEQHHLLLTNSISSLPLHRTLVLLDCLKRHRDDRYHRHELLALAKGLTTSIGNLHFGPEVGVGPAKADVPVVHEWIQAVERIVHDLKMVAGTSDALAAVHRSDARYPAVVLEPGCIDAVITSPPYPNEKDYTRTTRLESVLLGFIQSKADLRALKKGLVRSNTRSVYKEDEDDQWVAEYPEIQRIAADIEARRIQLGKTSGFERLYARLTKLYFGGMARHLAELRKVLKPGAQIAYVVGDQASYLRVMIRTGQLLADIAQSQGYRLMGIDLFRTRLATATKEQLREEVVLLCWPGN